MATRRKSRPPPPHEVSAGYSSPACYLHELQPPAAGSRSRGVEIKRIYAPAERADGFRVLIDRLWPRGISRRRAALDAWLADLAPGSSA
jgi:hypothetical protein